MTLYSFQVKTLQGDEVSLERYRGFVLLIVNVASRCGFTPQYAGLQKLQEMYGSKKFSVLAFPCNQFAHQEPGSASQIQDYCDTKWKVTFPLFEKIEVRGAHAHPLYRFLTTSIPGALKIPGIKWNFTKFLVDTEGVPVQRYAPSLDPLKIEPDIRALLQNQVPLSCSENS
jgi:glutathione peroxidase